MSDVSRRTPMYRRHVDAGAKMIPFAGWEMPLQYPAGAVAEHRLVRSSAGVFDVSHMGRIRLSGNGARSFLDHLLTNNMGRVDVGGSAYALLCRPDGTAIDDVFVYREPESWLVVLNAANHERDIAWIREHAPAGVQIVDLTESVAMVAVQGPRAVPLVDSLTNTPTAEIPRFSFRVQEVAGVTVTVARTGYTGEDGVELYIPVTDAVRVWDAVVGAGETTDTEIGACGLAARDSLRFEPGFALYGHELDDSTTPVEARLSWACDFEKPFIGRDALLEQKEQGVTRKLATVRLIEPGVPRQGFAVYGPDPDTAEEPVGTVATGMYAPTVDAYCANVFVTPDLARTGTILHIDIRGRRRRAEVVKRPLYTPAYKG